MRGRSRLLLAFVAAAAIVAFAVGTASAHRLENPVAERGFKAVWSALTLEAGGLRIVCPVTVEGGFSTRSIVKRARTSFGTITRASRGTCSEGTATILTETLPWDVQYSSYGGTLPNIESATILVIRASFRASSGTTCLTGTEVNEPARAIVSVNSGSITELRMDPTATIGAGGGFFCEFGTRAQVAGTATVSTAEGAAERLRLI